MAHIWSADPQSPGTWVAASLDASATYALDPRAELGARCLPAPSAGAAVLLFAAPAASAHARATWLLCVGATDSVRVNGLALPGGLRALRHRDEIRVERRRYYFSTERAAAVVPFPGAERPVICLRCRKPLAPRTPAVRCPRESCSLWVHQSAEWPCWTGFQDKPFSTCPGCEQPVALDGSFQWIPQEDS